MSAQRGQCNSLHIITPGMEASLDATRADECRPNHRRTETQPAPGKKDAQIHHKQRWFRCITCCIMGSLILNMINPPVLSNTAGYQGQLNMAILPSPLTPVEHWSKSSRKIYRICIEQGQPVWKILETGVGYLMLSSV